MDEYEALEGELAEEYDGYLEKFRNLDFLEHELDVHNRVLTFFHFCFFASCSEQFGTGFCWRAAWRMLLFQLEIVAVHNPDAHSLASYLLFYLAHVLVLQVCTRVYRDSYRAV